MIKHLVRQEKKGGYWLIRDEGRAVELTDSQYRFLAHHIATGSPDRFNQALSDFQATDSDFAQLLIDHQFGKRNQNKEVRLVQSDIPVHELPDDACSAPKRLYFEITRLCNLACKSCFNNSHFKLPNELTIEEIIDINRQAEEMGIFEIRYSGGECTRVPGFDRVIRDARERGFYISIGTNGVYTDEQLEWIPESGIDWFIISLDGDESTNDKVRGKGTYQGVLKTLKRLSHYPRIRTRLNMVVAKHNLKTIREVAKVCEDYQVFSLNLIPLRPYGRSTVKMTKDMFNQADFFEFIGEVNRLRQEFPSVTFSTTIDLMDPDAVTSHDLIVQKKKTCAAGVEGCVIGPLGHVYGCSYSPASFPNSADEEGKAVFIAGNIRDHSLKDIWRDSQRWSVFRNLNVYKNQKCHSCSHYTVRCSGSCQIMSYYQMKHQQAVDLGKKNLNDFMDPYCFSDLYDRQKTGKTADLASPCGGAGMDGF